MRLFTGIALPDGAARRLDELVRRLRPSGPKLRWPPVENLHITTKFIGEWPEDRLAELREALRGLTARPAFEIRLRGLGWFPNPHNPRVFWVGIQAPEALASLARDTGAVCARLGIAAEERPFSPHLTLARIKPPAEVAPLRRAVAALEENEFGAFSAQSFHLYLSEPGPGGSIYTSLEEYPLGGP